MTTPTPEEQIQMDLVEAYDSIQSRYSLDDDSMLRHLQDFVAKEIAWVAARSVELGLQTLDAEHHRNETEEHAVWRDEGDIMEWHLVRPGEDRTACGRKVKAWGHLSASRDPHAGVSCFACKRTRLWKRWAQ